MKRLFLTLALGTSVGYARGHIRPLRVTETKAMVVVDYAYPTMSSPVEVGVSGVHRGNRMLSHRVLKNDLSGYAGFDMAVPAIPCTVPIDKISLAFPEPEILQITFPKVPKVRCCFCDQHRRGQKGVFGQALIGETHDTVVVRFAIPMVSNCTPQVSFGLRPIENDWYMFG